MSCDEHLELGDQLRVPSTIEVRVDSRLQAGEVQLLEPCRLSPRERLLELRQRVSTPERKRLAEPLRREVGVPGRVRCFALEPQSLEPDDVDRSPDRSRSHTPAVACGASPSAGPCAAARRRSAPSSAPIRGPSRPRGRPRAARSRPSGWRPAAVAPAAHAASVLPGRSSFEPSLASSGPRSLNSIVVATLPRIYRARYLRSNRVPVSSAATRDEPARPKESHVSTTMEQIRNGVDTETLFATLDAVKAQPRARDVPVPCRQPLDRRRAQPLDDQGLLRRRRRGHLPRRGVRDRRR